MDVWLAQQLAMHAAEQCFVRGCSRLIEIKTGAGTQLGCTKASKAKPQWFVS